MGTPKLRVALTLALALTLAFDPATARGQEGDFVTLNASQLSFLEEGLDAHEHENYDRAIGLFQKALAQGEANILYLNLGRAYQKKQGCTHAKEAERMYQQALDAPMTEDPAPQLVMDSARRYSKDLRRECQGTVLIHCTPASARLLIDDKPSLCNIPTRLLAGTYTARAEAYEGNTSATTLEVKPRNTIEVNLQIERPFFGAISNSGWVVMGLGSAVIVTGMVFSVLAQATNQDLRDLATGDARTPAEINKINDLGKTADTYETAELISYGVGVVMITTSLLLLTDAPEANPAAHVEAGAMRFAPMLGTSSAGLVLEASY